MKIGDTVLVLAVSEAIYNMDGQRVIERSPCEPFFAVITGRTRKYLGEYKQSQHWDMDYEQAYLKVTGTRTLWLVRVGIENREISVDEADMELQSVPMNLPSRGRNPKIHRTPHEVVL